MPASPLRGPALRAWIAEQEPADLADVLNAPDPRGEPEDLYADLAKARQEAAVHPVGQHALAGLPDKRAQAGFQRPIFSVLRHDEARQALSMPDVLSSRIRKETIAKVWGHTILSMDGEEHRHHRALIAQAFSPRAIARWDEQLVHPIVHGLLDRIQADAGGEGTTDLLPTFHLMFPIHVITAMLGLPPTDIPRFNRLANETITVLIDPERGIRASRELAAYLDPIVDERRADPAGDLISGLAQAEVADERGSHRLDNEAIISFIRLLLNAGGETTTRSSATLLFALLSNPGQLAAVVQDRSLLDPAMEEGFRWEPPLPGVQRLAETDTEIGGVPIPADSLVDVSIGSASHDERYWGDPDRYDLSRPAHPHLAFNWGTHVCIGAHLARLETRTAITGVLDRLGDLAWHDDGGEPPRMRGFGFRSPSRLPVRFSTRATTDHPATDHGAPA